MEKNKIKHLIEYIKLLNTKYEEIEQVTGKSFNVFEASGIATKELIHEKFIGALLNPEGSHKQGDIFIKLFLKVLGYKQKYKNAKVSLEYFIDNDRRVDLVIELDNNKVLAVEMKIYAKDQEKQLQDYYNFFKNKYDSFTLHYLTLNGHEANENSTGSLIEGEDYHAISFQYEILDWIDLCVKEVATIPILRDGIIQYKLLLEKLTNTNKMKEDEVMEVLGKDVESIKAANEIVKNYIEVWATKECDFWVEVFNSVDNKIEKWKDGDQDIYNIWFDENGKEFDVNTENTIVNNIMKKTIKGKPRGISFVKEIGSFEIYICLEYGNKYSNICKCISIRKNTEIYFDEKLNKLFENFSIDDYSYWKPCNTEVRFLKSENPSFEVFDKNDFKKKVKDASSELIKLVEFVEKNL